VYALLVGKKTTDYDEFFNQLLVNFNYEPDSILLDFEQATINSVEKFFPDVSVSGRKEHCCPG
jgi:hypothetical protein